LKIHFETAAQLGIENGDLITLSTRHGTIDIPARLDDALRPDCLSMHHGCEAYNANELTGLEHFDPITGFPFQRAIPATIKRKSKKENV
jgi:anaerobic selenocysteine-containing dehydrogenase